MQEICSPGHAANPHLIFGFLQRLSLFAHDREDHPECTCSLIGSIRDHYYSGALFPPKNRLEKEVGKGAGNSVGMAHQLTIHGHLRMHKHIIHIYI